MRDTANHLLSTPLDLGWKVLTVLTVISTADMLRQITKRTKHLRP